MEKLIKRIESEIERVAKETGLMGTENISIRLVLTEDEKKMFVENEKYSGDNHYWWEFEENELIMTYTEDIKPSEALSITYTEWRKDSEEMLMDGIPGEIECCYDVVREDFSSYAELEKTITYEEMLELEKKYENTLIGFRYYNVPIRITDSKLSCICEYMNDEIREKLHSELAPCNAEKFLYEYIKIDEEFKDILHNEFHITLVEY